MAAKLVKSVFHADGVILTKIGGGAPNIDLARTCEACEELGVKTTMITQDQSYDGSVDGVLIFNAPKADAIVNVGSFARPMVLPAVERMIGGPLNLGHHMPAEGQIEVVFHQLSGVLNQLGASRVRVREV